MEIIEFSMTPAPKLIYVWKTIIGLVWAIVILLTTSFGIKEEFYALIAALIAIGVGNVVMLAVLILTSAYKNVETFLTDTIDVGNACLIALAVGSILFISIESVLSLKVSLMIVSIISSLIMGMVVVYMSTKLLNGNLMRIAVSNMMSAVLQAGIMYGVLFLIGF